MALLLGVPAATVNVAKSFTLLSRSVMPSFARRRAVVLPGAGALFEVVPAPAGSRQFADAPYPTKSTIAADDTHGLVAEVVIAAVVLQSAILPVLALMSGDAKVRSGVAVNAIPVA